MTIQSKILKLRDELNARLISRGEAIEASLLALLAQEHVILLGVPGEAKSYLIRLLCQGVSAKYFEYLLTKFTGPEEIFGPRDLLEYKKTGRWVRQKKGSLLDAEIGFIDEIYKGSSSILNTLLTLVNERTFSEGGSQHVAPLHTVFGASNEVPKPEDGLGALDDRFMLRVEVRQLKSDNELRELCLAGCHPQMPGILSMADLTRASIDVKSVAVDVSTRESWISIIQEARKEGLDVSSRRALKALRIIQAAAYLDGSSTAMPKHAECLKHVLWKNPEQRAIAEHIVTKVSSPSTHNAIRIEDAARAVYEKKPQPGTPDILTQLQPLIRELTEMRDKLTSIMDKEGIPHEPSNGAKVRSQEALSLINSWHGELATMVLQSMSGLTKAPGQQ